MLRIKFQIKTDRPKDLTPIEYEFTNGVVSSEHLTGKNYIIQQKRRMDYPEVIV